MTNNSNCLLEKYAVTAVTDVLVSTPFSTILLFGAGYATDLLEVFFPTLTMGRKFVKSAGVNQIVHKCASVFRIHTHVKVRTG